MTSNAQFTTWLTAPAVAAIAAFAEACLDLGCREGVGNIVALTHPQFPLPLDPAYGMGVNLSVANLAGEKITVAITLQWSDGKKCWLPVSIISTLVGATFDELGRLKSSRLHRTWF